MSFTHNELVLIASAWLYNGRGTRGAHPVVITEMTCSAPEQPDAIGFRFGMSTLVECKASRADFRSDRDKHFRKFDGHAMGNWRYFMAPLGVIPHDELPDGWGLVEVTGDDYHRPKFKEVRAASLQETTDRRYEIELMCSALRRQVCQGVPGVKVNNFTFDEPNRCPRAHLIVNGPPGIFPIQWPRQFAQHAVMWDGAKKPPVRKPVHIGSLDDANRAMKGV
jgi:hypothetical protein